MEADYSLPARALHRLVLGSSAVGEALFDLESKLYAAKAPEPRDDAVFVIGLARAGTTALMRALHDSGQFASLTYADMPGVMAPNLWARVSGVGRAARDAPRERAHGDGVLVSSRSPEALDEVFWSVHCGDDYVRPDRLVPHRVSDEVMERFRLYQRLVRLRHGGGRYLSKNNNGLLRLASLADGLPGATILIPFREPAAHVRSLMNQHQRFSEGSSFQRAYMTWLRHHEFGATHRPFRFLDAPAPEGGPERPEYWLDIWIAAYAHVLEVVTDARPRILPVAYERLCAGEVGDQLFATLGVAGDGASFRRSETSAAGIADGERAAAAADLYARLEALSAARLGLG